MTRINRGWLSGIVGGVLFLGSGCSSEGGAQVTCHWYCPANDTNGQVQVPIGTAEELYTRCQQAAPGGCPDLGCTCDGY